MDGQPKLKDLILGCSLYSPSLTILWLALPLMWLYAVS